MVTAMICMAMFRLNSEIRMAETFRAICVIESHGRADAVGDKGAALGIAQIHTILVDDVNRIQKRERFFYSDRLSPEKSYKMFRIYVRHYASNGGPEQWSRIWNGGPRGSVKGSTLRYWEKVHVEMLRYKRCYDGDIDTVGFRVFGVMLTP